MPQRPLPLEQMAQVDIDSSTSTFGTSETELGHATISATGKPVGATLAIKFTATLSAVTGTATLRLRKDSAAGTILATITTSAAADTVISATGTLTAPVTATRLIVTGQNSTGTSTMRTFAVTFAGDGTDPDFDELTGSGYTELSPWAGGLMFRDDTDRTWLLDRDAETAYSRDQLRRVFPQMFGAGHVGAKQNKPWAVLVGTDIWMFSLHTGTPSLVAGAYDASGYELTVLDGLDLTVKFTSTRINVTDIDNFAVVYDGSQYVWLFFVANGTTITAHKWDTANIGGSYTQTTYLTSTGATFQCIDAARLPHGEIAVVATSVNGHALRVVHSYLDASTGQADTSPAAVTINATAITPSAICCGGVSIFENQTDSATTWRYAYWQSDPADAAKVDLLMKTITGSTLAVASTTTLRSKVPAFTNDTAVMGQVCGYRDDVTGTVYWAGQLREDTSATTNGLAFNQAVENASVGGSITTVQGCWLASKPFKRADGDWYYLTGYDDGEDFALQRSMHVRPFGATHVIAQIGYSEMGPAYALPDTDTVNASPAIAVIYRNLPFVTPVVQVPAGRLVAGALIAGDTMASGQVNALTLDFDATYSRAAIVPGDALVYPGGVPQIAGPRDDLHDLSPLHGPNLATAASLGSGGALGTFTTCYLYRFIDASGRVYRSPVSPSTTHAFLDSGTRSLTVRNLLHIGRGTAFIEVYGSTATDSTPRLQHIIPNDPTTLTTTFNVNPARWSGTTEAVYTTGGGLVNFPPPACRCVAAWRDRVYLSGTGVDGEVWYSHEAETGIGVRLSPILRANWGNADGAIYGMEVVDWNYMALFRRAGVAVISGPGADGRGSGNYIVQALKTRCGTTAPFSLVSGPAGAYFQNAADGLIYLVTAGLRVMDVSGGVADHLSGVTVTAAGHIVGASQVWFALSDAKWVVLDYKFPTQDQPAGQWYRWLSDGLDSYCVGIVEESDGSITWLQANKALRRIRTTGNTFTDQDAGENDDPILMKLKTGKMPIAGAQGEVAVERIKFLGQHVGASTLNVAVTPDSGSAENHPVSTTSPIDYVVHPGQCLRIQELELTIEETASTTEGFVFDTVSVEFNPRNHGKRLPGSKFI